jgi:hypothetical protein
VSAARACTEPTSAITNIPDGGVVFVNAWRRQDAGNIDRLQAVVDVLTGNAEAFRCCFDVWTAEHADQGGKLMLEMTLNPDGSVEKAEVDTTRSTIDGTVTKACVLAVAKSLDYPESPSKRTTLVEYPFAVRASATP